MSRFYNFNEYDNQKRKKIRIISDLHLDVNKNYPLVLKDKNIFTVIAGDIAGEYNIAKQWLNENINNGVFVGGNHIFYNNERQTLQQLYKRYQNDFPLDNNVSFLQNGFKIIDDIVFVGCTLWTNYRLFGIEETRECLNRMNDFRFGYYEEPEYTGTYIKYNKVSLLPCHLIDEFKKSLDYIDDICKRYVRNKIVIVTHHCPSIKCLSKYYRNGGGISQAYASNLESFIKDHSNIVCWICGHSHNQCDFKIDGCRIVMNCRGYVDYDSSNKHFNENKFIYI